MGREWQLDDHNAEYHPEHDAELDAAFGTESVELELPEHGLGLRHGVLELERRVVRPVESLTGPAWAASSGAAHAQSSRAALAVSRCASSPR